MPAKNVHFTEAAKKSVVCLCLFSSTFQFIILKKINNGLFIYLFFEKMKFIENWGWGLH